MLLSVKKCSSLFKKMHKAVKQKTVLSLLGSLKKLKKGNQKSFLHFCNSHSQRFT